VDESPTPGENSAKELSVTPPASEPEAKSAQLESKEEATQVSNEVDHTKEVYVAKTSIKRAVVEM